MPRRSPAGLRLLSRWRVEAFSFLTTTLGSTEGSGRRRGSQRFVGCRRVHLSGDNLRSSRLGPSSFILGGFRPKFRLHRPKQLDDDLLRGDEVCSYPWSDRTGWRKFCSGLRCLARSAAVDGVLVSGISRGGCGRNLYWRHDDGSSQVGSWGTTPAAFVTPIPTPEPRQIAGMLVGIMALAIFALRRRKAVVVQ